MEKINQKSLIGSELERVKQKKDVVAVHMIGRQIILMSYDVTDNSHLPK